MRTYEGAKDKRPHKIRMFEEGEFNAESVLAGRELAVMNNAIRSADGLTLAAAEIVHTQKPNENITKRLYDHASRMSLDIRQDVRECAKKRSPGNTKIIGR